MRIATWNLLHGLGIPDGKYDRDRLVANAQLFPEMDLVALQEVDHGQPRTLGDFQVDVVGEAMNLPHRTFAPALYGTPGENWQSQHSAELPQFGVAVLSKQAPLAIHHFNMKGAPFGAPLFIPNSGFIYIKDEPRVAVAMEFEEFVFASTHLSFIPGFNVAQLHHLSSWLKSFGKPAMIAGDLNLPPALLRRSTKWKSLVAAKTYPRWGARTQLDYLLVVEPAKWGDVKQLTPPSLTISDHHPLLLECGTARSES
jgi:hypothetical protein